MMRLFTPAFERSKNHMVHLFKLKGRSSFHASTTFSKRSMSRKIGSDPVRSGAAIIEFAICLPIFFLIAIGTVETCRMIYLRQSLKIAAYECARVAIVPGSKDSDVVNQGNAILIGRRLKDFTLETTPSSVSHLKYGDLFKVEISIPAEPNALVGAWFYKNRTIHESVTIMAEY